MPPLAISRRFTSLAEVHDFGKRLWKHEESKTGGNKMEYKIISYRAWDGKKNLEEKSNNLKYFDRYLNKLNFRSQIYKKDGRRWKLIYSEI